MIAASVCARRLFARMPRPRYGVSSERLGAWVAGDAVMLTHCATVLHRRGTVALAGSASGEVLASETPAPVRASNSMRILRIRRAPHPVGIARIDLYDIHEIPAAIVSYIQPGWQ